MNIKKVTKPLVHRIKPVPDGLISYDIKTIIAILSLIFIYPIGIFLMWFWMATWKTWLKLIISIPFIIGVIFLLFILCFRKQ